MGAMTALGLLALAGCSGFSPPRSAGDQQALDGCRAEADRVYNAQNRYQLSEQNSRDSPNSGSGSSGQITSGLADRYSHSQMVDDCLSHSAAVPVTPAPPAQ